MPAPMIVHRRCIEIAGYYFTKLDILFLLLTLLVREFKFALIGGFSCRRCKQQPENSHGQSDDKNSNQRDSQTLIFRISLPGVEQPRKD
jgi:hypothetical protein